MEKINLYNSHNLAISIKLRAKQQNVVIKDMLTDCELGSNTMSALYHGKSIAFDSLAKIADYLECSVDYLLGRTNFPELLIKESKVNFIPANFDKDDEMLIAADMKKSVFPKEEDETTIL